MTRLITTRDPDELSHERMGTVIIGSDWHSEVYMKVGPDNWAAIGSEYLWSSLDLSVRGPFTVIHEGDDPRVNIFLRAGFSKFDAEEAAANLVPRGAING